MSATAAFTCPPDCGYCCTHLKMERTEEQAEGEAGFLDALREIGVYSCRDARDTGLVLAPGEARALLKHGDAGIHPHTYLLESKMRAAVIVAYHMPHESCPFYSDFRCTVYEYRPLPCRAYPVLAVSPRWNVHDACPHRSPVKPVRFAAEGKWRRTLDGAKASLDARAEAMLNDARWEFASALTPRAAAARLRSYRRVDLDAWPA